MRLISFERERRTSFGIVAGEGVIDAGQRLAAEFRGLREVLAAGALGPAAHAGETRARLRARRRDAATGDP